MKLRPMLFLAFLWMQATALAAVSVNSTCELSPQNQMSGKSINDSFVIASLSKIFTSQWALEKIGPQFQYETTVHLQKNADDTFDIHIQGDGDPTWGREMMHYFVSELDKIGVRKIRSLSFDENFFISWRAKAKVIEEKNYFYDFTDLAGAETYIPSTTDVRDTLMRHFIPRTAEYLVSYENARRAGIEMIENLTISAPKKVELVHSSQFSNAKYSQTFPLRSLPLFQIVKLMNVTSNNYLADMLYLQLGGETQFREYLKTNSLTSHASAIILKNGSGFPIKNGEKKFYNQSSCAGILESLSSIDRLLKKQNIGLESVFPVATSDKSTLDKYELPPDVMIAKTGTVNPTIALAGMVLTTDGPLFFSQLIKTENQQDWTDARARIKKYLMSLLETKAVDLHYQTSTPAFWAEGNKNISLPIP